MVAVLAGFQLAVGPLAAQQPQLLWSKQYGTSGNDLGLSAATDSAGNIIVAGATRGRFGGQPNAGLYDAFVAKFSPDGTLLWSRLLGGSRNDLARGVGVDRYDNIYIGGTTEASLTRQNNGNFDAFVAKYTPSGERLWVNQIGTDGDDWVFGAVVDYWQGSVVIGGGTPGSLGGPNAGTPEAYRYPGDRIKLEGSGWYHAYDVFTAKFSTNGALAWIKQTGTPQGEGANAIAIDRAGYVTVTGSTFGSLAAPLVPHTPPTNDVFIIRYRSDGALTWRRQFGGWGYDGGWGAATDRSGNVYISGDTSGVLNGGSNRGSGDAWVAKYSFAGVRQWLTQFGTAGYEGAWDVETDHLGNVFPAGSTGGPLATPYIGTGGDMMLGGLSSSDGTIRWLRQPGTNTTDYSRAVTTDPAGNVILIGTTLGSLAGPNLGYLDLVIFKYAPPH